MLYARAILLGWATHNILPFHINFDSTDFGCSRSVSVTFVLPFRGSDHCFFSLSPFCFVSFPIVAFPLPHVTD